LKLPGVRLFNAPASRRSDEFTPLKKPIDVVYYLDSDAYDYDTDTHQLIRIRKGAETTFALSKWDGWNNVIATRRVFDNPSFKDLDLLTISGAVTGANAIWSGRVEIVNEGSDTLDLTRISALQIDGRLTLDNVRVTRTVDDNISVTSFS
jgi:hypothetical protein